MYVYVFVCGVYGGGGEGGNIPNLKFPIANPSVILG